MATKTFHDSEFKDFAVDFHSKFEGLDKDDNEKLVFLAYVNARQLQKQIKLLEEIKDKLNTM